MQVKQEFGAIQSGRHDTEPLHSFFALKNSSAGVVGQFFEDQFQGEIVQ
jgi:hypothetical protein